MYPDRPDIFVDGEKIEHKKDIQGKSLEVYEYLVAHPGEHGVRDIQRELEYSSPSVVYYHLSKLIDLEYVSQNEETSQYYAEKEEIELGNVGTHIRFMKYWIPRSLFYAVTMIGLLVVSMVYFFAGIDSPLVWFVSVMIFSIILSLVYLEIQSILVENSEKISKS